MQCLRRWKAAKRRFGKAITDLCQGPLTWRRVLRPKAPENARGTPLCTRPLLESPPRPFPPFRAGQTVLEHEAMHRQRVGRGNTPRSAQAPPGDWITDTMPPPHQARPAPAGTGRHLTRSAGRVKRKLAPRSCPHALESSRILQGFGRSRGGWASRPPAGWRPRRPSLRPDSIRCRGQKPAECIRAGRPPRRAGRPPSPGPAEPPPKSRPAGKRGSRPDLAACLRRRPAFGGLAAGRPSATKEARRRPAPPAGRRAKAPGSGDCGAHSSCSDGRPPGSAGESPARARRPPGRRAGRPGLAARGRGC